MEILQAGLVPSGPSLTAPPRIPRPLQNQASETIGEPLS
jgi:hypothetical protein